MQSPLDDVLQRITSADSQPFANRFILEVDVLSSPTLQYRLLLLSRRLNELKKKKYGVRKLQKGGEVGTDLAPLYISVI